MTSFDLRDLPRSKTAFIVTFFLVAIIGAALGIVGQQLYMPAPGNGPNGTLQQAEQDFRNGNDQAAIAVFSALAQRNDPVAQYCLAHMTELGLGVPRDPAKSIELYKRSGRKLRLWKAIPSQNASTTHRCVTSAWRTSRQQSRRPMKFSSTSGRAKVDTIARARRW